MVISFLFFFSLLFFPFIEASSFSLEDSNFPYVDPPQESIVLPNLVCFPGIVSPSITAVTANPDYQGRHHRRTNGAGREDDWKASGPPLLPLQEPTPGLSSPGGFSASLADRQLGLTITE